MTDASTDERNPVVDVALGIIHGAHGPGRPEALKRLRSQLEPLPSWVASFRVHDERERSRDPVSGYGWAPRSWEWAVSTGASFSLILQDDTLASPRFWDVLQAMLQVLPRRAVLGLGTVSPDQVEWRARGKRWLTDGHGILGWGVGMWREEQKLVSDVERLLPRDHRSPHGDECRPDATKCDGWHEDVWLTTVFAAHGRPIWHPIPSILDHDLSVPSTNNNERHKTRRPSVLWDDFDLAELSSPDFWKP